MTCCYIILDRANDGDERTAQGFLVPAGRDIHVSERKIITPAGTSDFTAGVMSTVFPQDFYRVCVCNCLKPQRGLRSTFPTTGRDHVIARVEPGLCGTCCQCALTIETGPCCPMSFYTVNPIDCASRTRYQQCASGPDAAPLCYQPQESVSFCFPLTIQCGGLTYNFVEQAIIKGPCYGSLQHIPTVVRSTNRCPTVVMPTLLDPQEPGCICQARVIGWYYHPPDTFFDCLSCPPAFGQFQFIDIQPPPTQVLYWAALYEQAYEAAVGATFPLSGQSGCGTERHEILGSWSCPPGCVECGATTVGVLARITMSLNWRPSTLDAYYGANVTMIYTIAEEDRIGGGAGTCCESPPTDCGFQATSNESYPTGFIYGDLGTWFYAGPKATLAEACAGLRQWASGTYEQPSIEFGGAYRLTGSFLLA